MGLFSAMGSIASSAMTNQTNQTAREQTPFPD